MPGWDEVEALARELGVAPIEVVAAYAADAGVEMAPELSSEQRRLAALLDGMTEEDQRRVVAAIAVVVDVVRRTERGKG